MTLLAAALDAIRARRAAALARGVELIGVVGSVARGEDGPDSDVDIAYDIVGVETSLLDLGGIVTDLREYLGREVGMVDISRVKPPIRIAMERDLVRP